MGLPRPQSQGSNRPLQGLAPGSAVFRPSSAASLEPWSLQERTGPKDATVIELPTPEKSPGSFAKFARQRSVGLGSLWGDPPWLQSSCSDTELTGLSPFSNKGSSDGTARSWTRPHRASGRNKGRQATNSAWGRLDLGVCRDQLAQEAMLARRKLKANESDVMSKKANAARALAMDRQRADEKRKEAKESLSDYNARLRLDVERQLKRIFCPIQEPHLNIPSYWQNLNVDYSGKLAVRSSVKQKGLKPEPVVFVEIEPGQQVELLNMCQHFTSLTRPFQPAGESDAAIMTRPAFCRLLLELTIADSAGSVMYHSAIDIFDAMATVQSFKGLPLTSATVQGILLDDHSDRVIQLFAGVLAQASRESKNGATPEEFKLHLLDCLLPHAERKLRRRQKHIDTGLAYGKDIYRLPVLTENADEEEAEDEDVVAESPKADDKGALPFGAPPFGMGRRDVNDGRPKGRENLLGLPGALASTLSIPGSAAGSRMGSRMSSRGSTRSRASFAPTGKEEVAAEMRDAAARAILHNQEDYMTSRKVRAKDFFSKFDESGDGQIDSEELMKGITFMSLQGSLRTSISSPPPSFEEVESLFRLIDADGDGTLDYVELDIVMKTVQERKSKQSRSANFFIKDEAEMTELEKAALGFFVPLWNYMEANKKTVKDIFQKFDRANHGYLSFRELREVGEDLGFTCKYDKFDRAMMLVDGNLDGAVSPEELQKVLNFVKVRMDLLYKREQDKKDELKNPFVNKVTEQTKTDNEKNYKIAFFGLKAFIESILRSRFHGTPEQSTLPAATKALWVITHLQQQLSQLQMKEDTTVAEDVMAFEKRMGWEAALQQFGNKRKHLDKVMEEFRNLGYKPKNEEEIQENPWSDVSNLERIKCERPELFVPLPSMRPVVAGKNYERKAPCPECKAEPQHGWGNMYCPKCGHADGMIRACLANNKHYDLHKLPTLDRIICLLGTHTTPPGPMHRDDGNPAKPFSHANLELSVERRSSRAK